MAMALPIVLPLAIIGGSIGYFIQRRPGVLVAAPGAYSDCIADRADDHGRGIIRPADSAGL